MVQTKMIIEEIIRKNGISRENILPVLQEIVKQKNYIDKKDVIEIASVFDVSAAEIYGTASFYSFLDTEPRGKYVIRVCKSIVSVMKGKDKVINSIHDMLKIKVGETTKDDMFTLLETNDIGMSDKEPSMMINDEVYTDLTPEKVTGILKSIMRDREDIDILC